MSRKSEPRPLTYTYWADAGGKRVPKGTPGAKRVRRRTDTYYAWVGGKRVSLDTTDKAQAWINYREALKKHAEREAGIRDDFTEQASLPLDKHVDAWLASHRHRGTTKGHRETLAARVRALAALAGWKRVGDVSASTCSKALAALCAAAGIGAQTRNHYLSAARQFCRWCLADRRLRENPLVSLKPVSVEADRRHDRRCPEDAEVAALFAYLATGLPAQGGEKWSRPTDGSAPVRCGMSGPRRALGYRVAMATGFRADELRSLTRASFDLEAGTVTCRAAYDKRRRLVTQELPPWLVAELRAWFAAGGGTWQEFPAYHPGRLLKDDLAAAGVEYELPGPDGPLFFDFHALRVWYISQIASQPGIDPKTLMELARHSTPSLTLKVYAKVRRASTRAAVDGIKEPGKG